MIFLHPPKKNSWQVCKVGPITLKFQILSQLQHRFKLGGGLAKDLLSHTVNVAQKNASRNPITTLSTSQWSRFQNFPPWADVGHLFWSRNLPFHVAHDQFVRLECWAPDPFRSMESSRVHPKSIIISFTPWKSNIDKKKIGFGRCISLSLLSILNFGVYHCHDEQHHHQKDPHGLRYFCFL